MAQGTINKVLTHIISPIRYAQHKILYHGRRSHTPAERRKAVGKNREMAESYFIRIPDGHRNAIQRPANMNVDRIFRRMIEHANNNGDCIVNIGDGVFRPIPGDPVDEKAFHEYIGKELHRARAIQYKRLCMKQTFESWKKIGRDYNALHFDSERQVE